MAEIVFKDGNIVSMCKTIDVKEELEKDSTIAICVGFMNGDDFSVEDIDGVFSNNRVYDKIKEFFRYRESANSFHELGGDSIITAERLDLDDDHEDKTRRMALLARRTKELLVKSF